MLDDPAALMDPHYVHLLARMRRQGVTPANPLTASLIQAREAAESYYAFFNEHPPTVARIAEMFVPGPVGRIRLRFYWPVDRPGLPILVYFHGGGFVLNSLDTHDRLMRQLALHSGAVVCGVDYSLAPEHRYPTQYHESLAAIRWLMANGNRLGLDTTRLMVGGDSAGANLALVMALSLRDTGHSPVMAGVLFYGMFCADFDTGSHQRFGGGAYGLSTARMHWYWNQYLADSAQALNPFAAPLHAGLGDLPPLLLVGAGLDCLLDDTLRLSERLAEADVPSQLVIYPGVPHCFLQMDSYLPAARTALSRIGDFIQSHLGWTAAAA